MSDILLLDCDPRCNSALDYSSDIRSYPEIAPSERVVYVRSIVYPYLHYILIVGVTLNVRGNAPPERDRLRPRRPDRVDRGRLRHRLDVLRPGCRR